MSQHWSLDWLLICPPAGLPDCLQPYLARRPSDLPSDQQIGDFEFLFIFCVFPENKKLDAEFQASRRNIMTGKEFFEDFTIFNGFNGWKK